MSRERSSDFSDGDIVPCPWKRGGGGGDHCQLQLLALLQDGAFSRTFRCEDIDSKEEYLVKHVRLAGLSDSDLRCRLQEVDIWTTLRHPHILRCHFGWQRGDCELWILSETATQSVEQLILSKARAPPQPLFEKWLYQLASALKYLHEDQARPILHRNIKPSNIMVDDRFSLKLSDFGFSKVLRSDGDKARSLVGSGRTMSPEMLSGAAYNAKTDMWSVGISAVYIATQHHAVQARTFHTLFRRTRQGQVRGIAGQYERSVEEVVNGLLQVDPSLRPSASRLLQQLKLRFHNCARPSTSDSYPARQMVPQPTPAGRGHGVREYAGGGTVRSAGDDGYLRSAGHDGERQVGGKPERRPGTSHTVPGVVKGDGLQSRRPDDRVGNPGRSRHHPRQQPDDRRSPDLLPDDVVDGDANRHFSFGLAGNDGGSTGSSSSSGKAAVNAAGEETRPSASTQTTQFRSASSAGRYERPSSSSSTSRATQYPSHYDTRREREVAVRSSRTTQCPSVRETSSQPTDQRRPAPGQSASDVDSLCVTLLCIIIDERCSSNRSVTASTHSASRSSTGRQRVEEASAAKSASIETTHRVSAQRVTARGSEGSAKTPDKSTRRKSTSDAKVGSTRFAAVLPHSQQTPPHRAETQARETLTQPAPSGRHETLSYVTPSMTSEAADPSMTSAEVQMINTFPGAYNVRRTPQQLASAWQMENLQPSSHSSNTEGKTATVKRQASEPVTRATGSGRRSEVLRESGGDVDGIAGAGRSYGSQVTLSVADEANWPTNLRQYFAIARDLLSRLSPDTLFMALNYARLFTKEEVMMWLREQAGEAGVTCTEDILTLVQLNAQLDAETLQSMHHTLLHMGDPGHTSV